MPQRGVVSLEILNGGRYYFVAKAFAEEVSLADRGWQLRRRDSARKRRRRPSGEWYVDLWDRGNWDCLQDCECLLVGDTIATGTTLAATLTMVLKELRASGARLPDVHVLRSLAAAPLLACPPLLMCVLF